MIVEHHCSGPVVRKGVMTTVSGRTKLLTSQNHWPGTKPWTQELLRNTYNPCHNVRSFFFVREGFI
jgi:hypothetical protein